MATLTISSVGGDLRTIIRNWIFADGLTSEEDKGWFRSNFRVRGDDAVITRLSRRIDAARSIMVRDQLERQRQEDFADLTRLARRSYRRDLFLLWERNLLGFGATRDELTRMESTTIHAELAILDARGDADARRRLNLSIDEIGRLLYDHEVHDDTVSIMVKLHLAAIRTDVRAGRLAMAQTMADIEKIVGRRRLPSLA